MHFLLWICYFIYPLTHYSLLCLDTACIRVVNNIFPSLKFASSVKNKRKVTHDARHVEIPSRYRLSRRHFAGTDWTSHLTTPLFSPPTDNQTDARSTNVSSDFDSREPFAYPPMGLIEIYLSKNAAVGL